jgi:hypothetical protein
MRSKWQVKIVGAFRKFMKRKLVPGRFDCGEGGGEGVVNSRMTIAE